jgi:hypothetical protein
MMGRDASIAVTSPDAELSGTERGQDGKAKRRQRHERTHLVVLLGQLAGFAPPRPASEMIAY